MPDERCVVAEMYGTVPADQRQQLSVMVEDALLNPWAVGSALRNAGFRVTGAAVIKHRAKTCACGGWGE